MAIAGGGRGDKGEALKALRSPYVPSGTMVITYFGDQPLSHVRLVGACGETVDEFWAMSADCRPLLAKIVHVRQGQRR